MSITTEHHNLLKIVVLLMDYGSQVLREKMKIELSKAGRTLQDLVRVSRHKLIHFCKRKRCCECNSYPTERQPTISYKQLTLLLDHDENQTCTRPDDTKTQICTCGFKEKTDISVDNMDITLLSVFLLKFIKLDKTARKLIEKLRDERNSWSHLHSTMVPTQEFGTQFQDITHIINEIAKGIDYELFETLRKKMIDLESLQCSSQQLHCPKEMDVKSLEKQDVQTNTETQGRDVELVEYFSSLTLENLSGVPEQVLQQLKGIVDKWDSTTGENSGQKQQKPSTLAPCLEPEIEMTRITLDQHVSTENVFHATEKLQDSFHVLYTKHVLVLNGIPGSGKTTLAREVMYLMREDYTPIMLSNPDQLRHIRPCDKVIVFLDDIIGRSMYSSDSASMWYKTFDTMYTLSRQGSPLFILAFRENVFEDYRQDMDVFYSKLFSNEHIVKVSCMTTPDKEALVEKYCVHKGVSLYYGTEVDPVESSTKSLDRHTFKQICITQPLTGFPQCCFLFFTNEDFFKMGETFFKRPDRSLLSKVDQLRKSRDAQCRLQYALLAHIMLVDGPVDLITLAESEDFKNLTADFDLNQITFSKLLDCVEDAARSLLKVEDGQDKVEFRHQTIKEAVFISFSRHFPDQILQKSNLQLIKDFFRSKTFAKKTNEVVVTLQESCYTTLSLRLIHELKQKSNWNQCVGLQVFEDNNFAKNFVDTLTTAFEDKTDSNNIIQKLLLYSSEHGRNELLSELLRVCIVYDDACCNSSTPEHDFKISMTYLREEIISRAIKKGHPNVISSVVKKDRAVLYRSKWGLLPIHTAIWTGIRPVCDVLWGEYDKKTICSSSFKDPSGRRCVHYCALRGYIDKIQEIKSHGDEYVMAKDAQNQSALHYAVQGGQYQILHVLVGYGLSITDRTTHTHSVLQVLLMSLDYDERCKLLPPIPKDIMRAISDDSSVLWNNDYYRALEYILEKCDPDLDDLNLVIHRKHSYNIAHYACIDNAGGIVSLLLNKRRTLFSKRNSTSLPMAWDIAAFLGRSSILKTLLESGLICETEKSALVQIAKSGRKQARRLQFVDRRLLLNKHEREKIWLGCCFPFVIFGQTCDYDDTDKLLE